LPKVIEGITFIDGLEKPQTKTPPENRHHQHLLLTRIKKLFGAIRSLLNYSHHKAALFLGNTA